MVLAREGLTRTFLQSILHKKVGRRARVIAHDTHASYSFQIGAYAENTPSIVSHRDIHAQIYCLH